jgi:membrane-bound inhibitor of C-type lysozyme
MSHLPRHTQKQLIGAIAFSVLLGAEASLGSIVAHAATPLTTPILLSQAPPWRQTYVCGNFAITLSEQGRDRYSYQATNAKGQTLTVKNGTHHAGRNYSSIYTFSGGDGTQYVLEDYGGGKADLSIGNYPNSGMTYNCTTDGNP